MNKSYIVTHFINPNYFYLLNPHMKNDDLKKQVEDSLYREVEYLTGSYGKIDKPAVGNVVAFYLKDYNKYIRCEVDEIKVFNYIPHYFLFAIDYGSVLYTTQVQDIIVISEPFRHIKTPIIGPIGLKILPAKSSFDFATNRQDLEVSFKWNPRALDVFKTWIEGASQIIFDPTDFLHRGIRFGELTIITLSGEIHKLSEKFLTDSLALTVPNDDEFKTSFDLTHTLSIERWNDNVRSGGILHHNEGELFVNYETEIAMRFLRMQETKESRKLTIAKVMNWKKNIKGFEHIIPDDSEANQSLASTSISPLNRLLNQTRHKIEVKSSQSSLTFIPAGSQMQMPFPKRQKLVSSADSITSKQIIGNEDEFIGDSISAIVVASEWAPSTFK